MDASSGAAAILPGSAHPAHPRPAGRHVMCMRWPDLLGLHWPVPAVELRPLVPAGLEIDTFDGSAWIGLFPFRMEGVRAAMLPPIPGVPGTSRFPECNVRTYVSADGEAGVWFFTLDAAHLPAVVAARMLWGLNYRHARIRTTRSGDAISYELQRLDQLKRPHLAQCYAPSAVPEPCLACRWRIGRKLPASQPGELLHFFSERYCLYARNRRGNLIRGRIWHERWKLHEAQVDHLEQNLVAAAGIEVGGLAPIAYHGVCPEIHAWIPKQVAS